MADELGAPAVAAEARALAEREAEGRFYVACVGQFKRGKSTLINALVGARILPSGVVPVTSVPTVLRYGDTFRARVRLETAVWTSIEPASIENFVSEELNPENAKGVEAVEVFVPSALLASGMCLVDTPGLGSVFERNTAATRAFVPHIDAVVAVVGADPPIAGEELALLEHVGREVDNLVCVLNKADRVTEHERTEAVAFTQRVLQNRLGRPVGHVFVVSALDALNGGGATWEWNALVARLRDLAAGSGRALVRAAAGRGVTRLGARLQRIIHEEVEALTRPLAESEARVRELTGTREAAGRALADLAPLLSAEQARLGASFAERRETFLREVERDAADALSAAIRTADLAHGPAMRRHAFEAAQAIARARLEPWLADSERAADKAYQVSSARFVTLAADVLRRLDTADGWDATDMATALERDEHFGGARRFFFLDFHRLAVPAGLGALAQRIADAILPRPVATRRIEGHAQAFLRLLLETNAWRVEGDLKQRLEESRRRLETDIRRALADARDTAIRAVERARVAQAAGHATVDAALVELDGLRARVAMLMDAAPRAGD